MKHPLTSKERRGLVAVAAATLLCIASGFIFRNCSGIAPAGSAEPTTSSTQSSSGFSNASGSSKTSNSSERSDSTSRKPSRKKKPKQKKKRIAPPERDPLSQPCD